MPNIEKIKKYKKIHMIGIGGISMSGIAEILVNWGFTVTGSDFCQSETTDTLISRGINVCIGHNINLVSNADLVVYSAAIKQDDPEIIEAKKLNIPIIERADFLGELTRCFENTIAISGTHGKTTTTSMVSLCFIEALLDPTIQVGANLKQINGNYKIGNSENFIIEACEYVESFLKFSPKSEIILNIDNDHLDYFKNFDNIKNAFIKYVKLLPDDGFLILNADDDNCLLLNKYTNAKCITYGINNKNANFIANNIIFDNNGFAEFDVIYNNKFFTHIKLSIPGKHNVLNCLACIALCNEYNISTETMKNALLKFTGANRRFEYKGNINGASIYDDYAHHPTEITATANSLKNKTYNNSWVVFQPHTYSRTIELLDDFAQSLLNFDNIIIIDIYAARETNTYGVTSQDLCKKIVSLGGNAIYIHSFSECVSYLKNNLKTDDILITLGAGTVTEIGPMLLEQIKNP